MPVINTLPHHRIFVDKTITIQVSQAVLDKWQQYKQYGFFSTEAFGVLLGAYSPEDNIIYVTDCTEPMQGDSAHRYSFKMRDVGHRMAVEKIFDRTQGTQSYLGTWHTHPERHPRPSKVDKDDWKGAMDINPKIPQFLFVIVGTETISYFPRKHQKRVNDEFVQLA